MIRLVFLLTFVVAGGEVIHASIPQAGKHERDFSNIVAPAPAQAAKLASAKAV